MSRQVDVKALVSHIIKGDGEERCRICMGETSEGQVFLGDTVMMDGTRAVTLAELLVMITGIELVEERLMPKGACVTCVVATLAAYELRNLVARSQKTWNEAIAALETMPYHLTPSKSKLYAVLNGDPLELEIIQENVTENPLYTINTLKSRAKRVYPSRKPRTYRYGPQCRCTDCGKSFNSPFYLNVHLQNNAQKEACLTCGAIVIRGRNMQEHLLKVHDQHVLVCNECPLLFKTTGKLTQHRRMAHKPGAFTCSDCGRSFTRASSFEAHAQMHAVRTCRNCGAQFENRGCYRVHRALCEPEAKPVVKLLPRNRRSNVRDPATYTCDYCKKTYNSRPQLKNHIIWIHMDVRPHQCNWCGKRFYTSARLAEHTVVHTRERNFSCDICGAKLVTKMAMIYHRRRHTGEKPYECADCGERFISASRRTEHAKRRHGKGKLFHCTQCQYTFVRGHELRKHLERAHKISTTENPKLCNVKELKPFKLEDVPSKQMGTLSTVYIQDAANYSDG